MPPSLTLHTASSLAILILIMLASLASAQWDGCKEDEFCTELSKQYDVYVELGVDHVKADAPEKVMNAWDEAIRGMSLILEVRLELVAVRSRISSPESQAIMGRAMAGNQGEAIRIEIRNERGLDRIKALKSESDMLIEKMKPTLAAYVAAVKQWKGQ